MASPDWQRILGVRFFGGAAPDAVDYITRVGGYTVVPAAPALVKIENDPTYRRALVEAECGGDAAVQLDHVAAARASV